MRKHEQTQKLHRHILVSVAPKKQQSFCSLQVVHQTHEATVIWCWKMRKLFCFTVIVAYLLSVFSTFSISTLVFFLSHAFML